MNFKILVSLVIAALMLVGCAGPAPANSDGAAPAMNQQENAQPVGAAANPASAGSNSAVAVTELTADEAAAIALNHAGVSAEDASYLKTNREVDDGTPEFDIEFRSGDYEYDYTVHAVTGEILEQDKEYDPPKSPAPVETAPVETTPAETAPVETKPVETTPPPTEPEVVELTADEAIAAALKHAGLSADEVEKIRSQRDMDDGKPEFDIDFRSGDYEYDYTIDALTGKILDWDKEYDPPKSSKPAESAPAETVPASTELTADEAVAIALNHAGLTADQVTRLKYEPDRDDGKLEWEVEFYKGDMEYSYTIDAETGKILEWEQEKDD